MEQMPAVLKKSRQASAIVIDLVSSDNTATVNIFNGGPPTAGHHSWRAALRSFEYGVSEQPADGNRGLDQFIAHTYIAKLGSMLAAKTAGTMSVSNLASRS